MHMYLCISVLEIMVEMIFKLMIHTIFTWYFNMHMCSCFIFVCTENHAEIENLSGSLKEEKQLRRKYEADLKVLQEECVELRDEKDNLEKVSMKWTLAKTLLDSKGV